VLRGDFSSKMTKNHPYNRRMKREKSLEKMGGG